MNTSVSFYQLRKGAVEERVFMFQTFLWALLAMGFLQGTFPKFEIYYMYV